MAAPGFASYLAYRHEKWYQPAHVKHISQNVETFPSKENVVQSVCTYTGRDSGCLQLNNVASLITAT